MNPAVVVVKVAVLREDGCILLLQRSTDDTHRPSGPDLPGGGREPGEDILAAAARELHEETGLNVPAHDLQVVFTNQGQSARGNQPLVRVLCGIQISGTRDITLSNEHASFRWVSVEEAVTAFDGHTWGEGLQQLVAK